MLLEGPFIDVTEDARTISLNTGQKIVLMSVKVEYLQPRDVLLVLGQVEITNPFQFNVGFGRYVLRAKTTTDVEGIYVVPANMDNITPGDHHRSEDFWAVDTGVTGSVFYNLIAYAVASGGGGDLTVEQKYGKLVVLNFRR